MEFRDFNTIDNGTKEEALFACCGSVKWVKEVLQIAALHSEKELVDAAENAWYNSCENSDYLESFTHHPQIGDIKSLQEKFAGKEQASIAVATQETIEKLAAMNADYKSKFGFIFIVCATGKSAQEMLQLLSDRISNSLEEEITIAMGEQMKITIIRFQKLLPQSDWSFLKVSQLTTHVLDTSIGKPGKNISIKLQERRNENWFTISQGITNTDGRIADLLAQERILPAGNYNLIFNTQKYFDAQNTKGFYPEVSIQFCIEDASHYHVPLLINPYGYSTYRGS